MIRANALLQQEFSKIYFDAGCRIKMIIQYLNFIYILSIFYLNLTEFLVFYKSKNVCIRV